MHGPWRPCQEREAVVWSPLLRGYPVFSDQEGVPWQRSTTQWTESFGHDERWAWAMGGGRLAMTGYAGPCHCRRRMACSGGAAVSMSQTATPGCAQHACRARQVMDEGRDESGLVQAWCSSNLLFRWDARCEDQRLPNKGRCVWCMRGALEAMSVT
jgi:hypothetical protein